MLKPILSGELSSFQAYQFKVIYDSCDDDWKDLSFEHAQVLIQEMKDSMIEPKVEKTNTSNSNHLQEDVAESPPCSKRSKHYT